MSRAEQINETELRKSILQLFSDGDLFEVRIIPGNKRKPLSGYFKDVESLLDAFQSVDLRNANVYVTLQKLDGALFSRMQSNHFVAGANATSDNEVLGYRWLFIDLDPVRPTGISSSKDELQEAFNLAKRVQRYMSDIGFEDPVKAVSGNGAHLLYRIALTNEDDNRQLLEKCLKALSMLFDNEKVKIDTINFNPSRICKLYGTLAQKGTSTDDRPYRMSYIVGEIKDIKVTSRDYLVKLAGELPQEVKQTPTHYNAYNGNEFDIESWMDRYGLRYKVAPYKDGTKYILDECPFDPSHKAPDSMITKSAAGAIGFKCLHNSCSGYHWRDLRLKFEPLAYEYNDADRRIDEGIKKHNKELAEKKAKEQPTATTTDEIPIFQTAQMIIDREDPDPEYVATGIYGIDKKLSGLEKGKLTVLSGLRASAKSTVLSEIALNAVDDGHVVVAYSGELSDKSYINWTFRQAAGNRWVIETAQHKQHYFVERKAEKKIAEWMDEKLWLYNNKKHMKPLELAECLKMQCMKVNADLLIIDNLMALDVASIDSSNEYNSQTKFMWRLKGIASECNTHIILVAHPRKRQGNMGALRLDDIAGTGNLANIADNVFIIHRINNEFKKNMKAEYGWKYDEDDDNKNHWLYQNNYTNTIEIAKDRENGTCDEFVGLYFDVKTKRLKNSSFENRIYGWDSEDLEQENPFTQERKD